MRIDKSRSIPVNIQSCLITCNSFFCPTVINLCALFVDRQIIYRHCPAVSIIQGFGLPIAQCNRHRCGADPITVIPIVPDFFHRNALYSGNMLIRNDGIVSIRHIADLHISGNSFLSPGIMYFTQIIELANGNDSRPILRSGENCLCPIIGDNSNRFRPHAVLILVIVPDLCYSDIFHHNAFGHFSDNNETTACICICAGGQCNDLLRVSSYLFIEVHYLCSYADTADTAGAQEVENAVHAVSYTVYLVLICVSIQHSEKLNIINLIFGNDNAGLCTVHIVQAAKHSTAVHVMAIESEKSALFAAAR